MPCLLEISFGDDEHAHANSSSDESSNLEDSYDPDTKSIQRDAESVHPYANAELE
jgi:hypothetical protein